MQPITGPYSPEISPTLHSPGRTYLGFMSREIRVHIEAVQVEYSVVSEVV